MTTFDRTDIGRLVTDLFDWIQPIEGDLEIAPGVRAVWTGGHSPGHQQIEVALGGGLAIITGDTAYLVDPGVTEQLPPGYVTSIPGDDARARRHQGEGDICPADARPAGARALRRVGRLTPGELIPTAQPRSADHDRSAALSR